MSGNITLSLSEWGSQAVTIILVCWAIQAIITLVEKIISLVRGAPKT